MEVTFRRLEPDDLPRLAGWLAAPHVHRWWFHETTPDALERDFGAVLRGEEPAEDLVAVVDGRDVGLCQRSRWHDYPDEVAEIAPYVDLPAGAVTIDYLLGDVTDTGRGVGPAVIAALVADTWTRYPDCPAVVVPVAAGNRASWRALEKAGFRHVGTAELEPDNPVDPRDHVVLRIERP
jgi:aminoglycoside 6'-N-acetyltransferase